MQLYDTTKDPTLLADKVFVLATQVVSIVSALDVMFNGPAGWE
jgi:hypothetical protein